MDVVNQDKMIEPSDSATEIIFDFNFTSDRQNALLLKVTRDGSSGIETPLGWRPVIGDSPSSSYTHIFYHDPVANVPVSSVFLVSDSNNGQWAVNVYEIDDVLPESFIDIADYILYESDDINQDTPQILTTVPGGLLFTGIGTNGSPVVNLDGAITPGQDARSNANPGIGAGHTSGFVQLGAAGLTPVYNHTLDTGNDGFCYVIALKPAGVATNATLHTLIIEDANVENFTAGNFVNASDYEIVTIGTTDFTAIGAASNTIGVRFKATGIGTGTGTANIIKPLVCEAIDFSAGITAYLNKGEVNEEIASEISAIDTIPTSKPTISVTFSKVPVNGVDTVSIVYVQSAGNIKAVDGGIPLPDTTFDSTGAMVCA